MNKTTLKLQREAAEQRIELVGPGRSCRHRTYRLDCGHEQEIDTSNVRRGAFRCKTCQDEKLHTEAAEQSIELIGPGRDARYRTYKLACNHQQEITVGDVRNGMFACRTCGNHSWTKPSHLYVVRVALDDGQTYIKLGVSNNVERRIKQYGLPHYTTATILATALFHSREEADVAESMLFDRYANWKIPPAEVDDIFTIQGHTEVYHHSIEDSARLFVRDLDFLLRKASS